MNGSLNVNGKRAGDPPSGERRALYAKTSHGSNDHKKPLSNDIKFQLKILANVDPKVPFFAETAQGVIDAFAAEKTPSPEDLEQLLQALEDQGGDRLKINAAKKIWTEGLDLQVLRDVASRITTADAAEVAVRAFISGLKEFVGAGMTTGRENAIINNLKAAFTGNSYLGIHQYEAVRPSGPASMTAVGTFSRPSGEGGQSRTSTMSTIAGEILPKPADEQVAIPVVASRSAVASASGPDDAVPEDANGGVNLDEIDRLIQQESQKATSSQATSLKPLDTQTASQLPPVAQDDIAILRKALISPHESATNGITINGAASNKASASQANVGQQRDIQRLPPPPLTPARSEPYIKQEESPLDRPLSDRISKPEKVPFLQQREMTCWFWFTQHGNCTRGHNCHFQHRILDYIAEYKPGSFGSKPFKIIKRPDAEYPDRELSSQATLNAMRGEPVEAESHRHQRDYRTYDPYERAGQYANDQGQYSGGQHGSYQPRTSHIDFNALKKSDTPIVDMLTDGMLITLGGREDVIAAILGNIKSRRNASSKDFVTQLYDANGKYTGYSIDKHEGLYSKLAGMWANARSESEFDAPRVKHMMENMLRPFVVANKSKFLDLPDHSFHSSAAKEDGAGHAQNSPYGHKNWSQKF